jgi:hypothetical protein
VHIGSDIEIYQTEDLMFGFGMLWTAAECMSEVLVRGCVIKREDFNAVSPLARFFNITESF